MNAADTAEAFAKKGKLTLRQVGIDAAGKSFYGPCFSQEHSVTTDIPAEGPPGSKPPAWEPYAQTLSGRLQDVRDSPLAHLDDPVDARRARRAERHVLDEEDVGGSKGLHIVLPCLAATFGSEQSFQDEVLGPGAVTMLSGFNPKNQGGVLWLIEHVLLPADWSVRRRGELSQEGPTLLVCRPELRTSGRLDELAQATWEGWVREAIGLPHPVLVLVPEGVTLSDPLRRALPPARRLQAVDRHILLMLLTTHYGETDTAEREALARLLPDAADLAQIDHISLLMALRAPTARDAARKIRKQARRERGEQGEAMTLEEIGGTSPAHQAGAALAADAQDCCGGKASWSDIPRSLLLHGEPGTGKTVLAQAIARSAGLPILIVSAAEWQALGHLGDMLGGMLKSFSEAAALRPCVLFIDEIDSFGARDSRDRHNSNYRRQVINALLREIDKFLALDGTLLLGACNAVETLDPAILRPGRFDQIVELTRPPLGQIAHMLRQVFPGAADVTPLARLCAGRTPAEIDATLRAARATARRDGVPFDADLLAAQLGGGRPDHPALERRIALHEAGHTLVAARLLGAAAVERVVMSAEMGQTFSRSAIREGTAQDFEIELTILLAGRAAERLVLGDVSAGSGGSPGSDLERATRLQLFFDRQSGLGIHGPAWLGVPDPARLPEAEQARLRAKLIQFEQRAQDLLAPHRDLLVRLSEALLLRREMTAEDLKPWFDQLPARG